MLSLRQIRRPLAGEEAREQPVLVAVLLQQLAFESF
jgi:hypothetical protein